MSVWTPGSQRPGPCGEMQRRYADLRNSCCAIEELIERHGSEFTEKELKRLDKAVTTMKVAFKIVKKVVRERETVEPLRLVR